MTKSTFSKPPTKDDLRKGLGRDVDEFLSTGGSIDQVAQGETALEARTSPLRTPVFAEPRVPRTPVADVVAGLDERRKAKLKRSPEVRRARKPRRKKRVIYDDFGEALRTVWVEE